MKIDVQIEDQLQELWSQMGLSEDDIEEQYNNLRKKIEELFDSYLSETYDKVLDLQEQAEKLEKDIMEQMHKYELGDDYGIDLSQPLLRRIKTAQRRLNNIIIATSDQRDDFEKAFEALSNCYDLLEISDRGEFQEKGAVYSAERIDAMVKKTAELQGQLRENRKIVVELTSSLDTLREGLGLEPVEQPKTFGEPTIESLRSEVDELTDKLDNNRGEIQSLISEIRRLQKLLNIAMIPSTVSNYSDRVLHELKDKFNELQMTKNSRLPEFVDKLKDELLRLWGELHIETPGENDFPFFYQRPSKRVLIALESETLRLENIKKQIAPLITLIAQRDEIIDNYNNLQSTITNTDRLTSRRGGAATALLQEERVRKRYQIELPKIHEQMIPLLKEYQDMCGEPLMWDGRDLLEEVEELHKRETAINITNRVRTQSVSGSSRSKSKKLLSHRAPFQLQGFML